jgi:hypothetical protein
MKKKSEIKVWVSYDIKKKSALVVKKRKRPARISISFRSFCENCTYRLESLFPGERAQCNWFKNKDVNATQKNCPLWKRFPEVL